MTMVGVLFTVEALSTLSVMGILLSFWIFRRTGSLDLFFGLVYFSSLPLLQAIQFHYLAPELPQPSPSSCTANVIQDHHHHLSPCDTHMNKFFTLLTFLHLCFQPYFCHLINAALTRNCQIKDRYVVIKRLCFLGGLLLFARYYLAFLPSFHTHDSRSLSASVEWLRGPKLCTFKTRSMFHLGWSVPLADPSYLVPGISLHAFLLFAPFIIMIEQRGMLVQGLLLFATGPFAAMMLSDNLMEQAALWGAFSMLQILFLLIIVRECLLVNQHAGNLSIFRESMSMEDVVDIGEDEEGNEVVMCRYLIDCPYCAQETLRRRELLLSQAEKMEKED